MPSYNVQLLTDTRHGIVVNVEASIDAIDYRQLGPAIERCETMLGRKPKQIVADGDYTNHASVQAPQLVASTFMDRGKTAGSRWTAMRKAAGRRSWPARFLTLPGGTASLVPPDRSCPIRLCRIARTASTLTSIAPKQACPHCPLRGQCARSQRGPNGGGRREEPAGSNDGLQNQDEDRGRNKSTLTASRSPSSPTPGSKNAAACDSFAAVAG